jgi:hypothetical protein
VSSLWTPDGERPIRPPDQGGGKEAPVGARGPAGGAGSEGYGAASPPDVDEQVLAEQMAVMRAELANSPVEVVVANHCYGLFELAAVYLSQQPPLLPQARVAIDALGSLVEGLTGRLGEAEDQLKDGLSQLRLAYVQIDGAQRAGAEVASAVGVNGDTVGREGGAPETGAPGSTGPAGVREDAQETAQETSTTTDSGTDVEG